MPWWAWAVAVWCALAPVAAFVLGRGIRVADDAARPETASDASERGLRTTTPDRTRPDAGDPSQRPESACVDDWMLTAEQFIERYYTPGLVSPPKPDPRRKEPT